MLGNKVLNFNGKYLEIFQNIITLDISSNQNINNISMQYFLESPHADNSIFCLKLIC